jgi:nitric-oxide synthase
MSEVCDVIYNKHGHFYICGDVRMAAEVTNRLELALTKQKNMTIGQAKNYINEMKENLRFHEDIFGNSVNTIENK